MTQPGTTSLAAVAALLVAAVIGSQALATTDAGPAVREASLPISQGPSEDRMEEERAARVLEALLGLENRIRQMETRVRQAIDRRAIDERRRLAREKPWSRDVDAAKEDLIRRLETEGGQLLSRAEALSRERLEERLSLSTLRGCVGDGKVLFYDPEVDEPFIVPEAAALRFSGILQRMGGCSQN